MQIAARVIKKHGKSKVVQGMSTPTQAPVNAEGDTIGGFEIMSNVVWAEIGRALMDQLGALIFAAGKPAEFKAVGHLVRWCLSVLSVCLELYYIQGVSFGAGVPCS